MNILTIALWGAAVPALLTLLSVLLAHARPSAKPDADPTLAPFPLRALLIPLAVAAAISIAFVSIMGPLDVWPVESVRRVPHALALAAILAAVVSPTRLALPALAVAIIAATASSWAILEVLTRNTRLDAQSLWTSIAILTCLASPAPALLARPARANAIPPLTLSLSLLAPFLCLSIALMLAARTESGARLAASAVAVSAALAASSLLPARFRRPIIAAAPSITIVLLTLMVALLAWGRFFAGIFTASAWHPGLPWASLALFAFTPTLAAALLPPDRAPSRRRSTMVLAASAIASIAALALALTNRPSSPTAENPYADLIQDP